METPNAPPTETKPLNVSWIHGAPNCAASTDPPIQIYEFDERSYILRFDKCRNFEAPFSYLLLGDETALLLGTGPHPNAGGIFPVRETVDAIIDSWATRNGKSNVGLIVAHSHSHGDHAAGDSQFLGRENTRIIDLDLDAVIDSFGLDGWPNATGQLDLGNRPLTILPIPGHQAEHIAIHDPTSEILLTGDTVYPGMLTVRDWDAYSNSISKLNNYAKSHCVSYVLGAHIEMTRHPGVLYDIGTTYQPEEHVLELFPSHLLALDEALTRLGGTPQRHVLDDFIIQPL